MGGLSLMHWAILIIIFALLFGRGRVSSAMGDLGRGLKNLRDGLTEGEREPKPLQRLE